MPRRIFIFDKTLGKMVPAENLTLHKRVTAQSSPEWFPRHRSDSHKRHVEQERRLGASKTWQ